MFFFLLASFCCQVIRRATAYKRLLLTIKGEYDDVIRELQRREDEAMEAQRNLVASTSHPKSLITCQRRAAQLRDKLVFVHLCVCVRVCVCVCVCVCVFVELFDSAQYEEAALHAARSPRGVLRNLDTMNMFKGVSGPPRSVPPLLLYFQALLLTLPSGDKLSAPLAKALVLCALQHGDTQLVNHTVTHNKLTCSEDLGDILSEHAQKNPRVADLCLALATDAYKACRLNKKTALSMCKRGLVHSAAEFMNNCKDLTTEDCLWVLYQSPSVSLLQLLIESQQGQAAILSVGVVLSTLLADPQQQELALQLLDSFVSRGQGVLEEVILEDSKSLLDDWTDVASTCSELNRADLSQVILSILLDQSGTRVLSPDLEGAGLVEHVFL
uniref:Translin-associated factor X-interacting protein 1 N-terminal domain-containing protein n=1 Tax=Labrus bergylta TaxID=56723 RepID=A0A3Q3E444_9LABR